MSEGGESQAPRRPGRIVQTALDFLGIESKWDRHRRKHFEDIEGKKETIERIRQVREGIDQLVKEGDAEAANRKKLRGYSSLIAHDYYSRILQEEGRLIELEEEGND